MIIRAAHPADAHGIATVHVDSWRSTYVGIVPDEVLERLSYDNRGQFWQDILTNHNHNNPVFVAEDDAGQITGFASGGKERGGIEDYDGELYAIYLQTHMQGHGIGRRLVCSVATTLAEQGFSSMLTWVLADNPARHFYVAMGGVYVTEQDIQINGTTLSEIAYGWSNIQALLELKEKYYGDTAST